MNYGETVPLAGNTADTTYAGIGVYDDSYQTIFPSINAGTGQNQNICYIPNEFNGTCNWVNDFGYEYFFEGCQALCNGFPTGVTYVFYDSEVPSAQSLLVPATVELVDAGYDGGAGFPSLTFTLGTTINNLGGADVPDASVNYSVYLSTGIVTGVGNVCPGNGLPCLGDYTQPVATGTLGPYSYTGGQCYLYSQSTCGTDLTAGPGVVTPISLAVGIPPPSGIGIYYAQMNFGAGSPVESAISGPLEFGPDPAAASVGQVPPLPKPDGTFTVKPRIQNVGFMPESFFNFSLYLSKDGCDAGFDASKAPYLGTFNSGYAGALAALSDPTEYPVVTLTPTLDAGIVQAGTYAVVVVVQSKDDLNHSNDVACSANQIAISPPSLKTEGVRAPALCYVAGPDAGSAHYGCDVPYSVSNQGTELALNFYMGVYAQEYYKGPSPNPLVAAQMYYPDVNFRRGVWGPITLGGQCTMTVSGFGQIVNFSPPGLWLCARRCSPTDHHRLAAAADRPARGIPEHHAVRGRPPPRCRRTTRSPSSRIPTDWCPARPLVARRPRATRTSVAFADPDLTVFAGDLIAPTSPPLASP